VVDKINGSGATY